MSRGRPLVLTALVLVLVGLVLPAVASAQATPPLAASLVFDNPPANLTFNATTPIKINVILANVSGAPIITIAGFSLTEFWRNLYFQLEGVGTITDASASLVHGFTPFGTCHYRNSVLLPGAGVQVTPVEVLPGNYAVQFSFDDARTHFDLSRPGRYTVDARIAFYVYDSGAIITDCNIEFGSQSLLSIGDNATLGRHEFSIVSNSLEFVIPDTTPPTVTPPASVTVTATEAGGARGSTSPTLAAFLAGGSATDDLDAAPTLLSPQVAGGDVDNSTLFPIGTTAVTFRFQDTAENIGSATANVTVTTTTGTPAISVAIVGSGVRQGRVFFYDIKFTNSGTDLAKSVALQKLALKTLSGSGNVTFNPSLSPKLPLALGDLAVGASTTIRVYLSVPKPVKQFSMTESGQLNNAAGATLSFSTSQTVSP